eukprot:CAMPEP_0167826616 /NCGR_PEP_ID=MMETSP0112_2-20121227/10150_1 /TAXON_ID=91324 /ORGANISM="Lotharella globosa, Strain CCCM811" /LENGTH=109 /DNA_ID=CAMNT_0007729113 /DNA_START=147 /DNA_END=473 /DNA_ORIENTATION=+
MPRGAAPAGIERSGGGGSDAKDAPPLPPEARALDEFEKKMATMLRQRFAGKDKMISDTYALQFIRGYRGDKNPERVILAKYEEMLKKRSEYNIDNVVTSRPEGWEEFNK